MFQTSDWVIIFTALFLGACALFVPFVAELIKRRLFAPELRIQFSEGHPYCHLTKRGDGSPVYYFRFRVFNEGKSQARFSEVVLEEVWLADKADEFVKDDSFSPVNLTWVGQYQQTQGGLIARQFVDINPKREIFCDIGHISSPDFQRRAEKSQYYLEKDSEALKFFFDTPVTFFSQRDCISRGKAKIKVRVYSENAPKKCERYFQISWSGVWKAEEQDMFREIVIS